MNVINNDVPICYELYMRTPNDPRPDFIVKRDAYIENVQNDFTLIL